VVCISENITITCSLYSRSNLSISLITSSAGLDPVELCSIRCNIASVNGSADGKIACQAHIAAGVTHQILFSRHGHKNIF
jgi:hypothetical protein